LEAVYQKDLERNQRTEQLFQDNQSKLFKSTDLLFLFLLYAQWAAAILCALAISPRAWEGSSSHIHFHVWAALLLGGLINLVPTLMIYFRPGASSTRHVIAASQMLWSGLLIHLTGGRIETHFHVFGSLAFLSFYRDWRILLTATTVTITDHFLRSFYWPQSVYGINYQVVYGSLSSATWRWLEHAGWVIFCDIFLVFACLKGLDELRELCKQQTKIEEVSREKSHFLANMSHEIRTPLHGILSLSHFGKEKSKAISIERIEEYFNHINESGSRLLHLLNDLLDLSKLEANKVTYSMKESDLREVVKATSSEMTALLEEKKIHLELKYESEDLIRIFDREKITQVMRNLLSNAVNFSKPNTTIVISLNKTDSEVFCRIVNYGVGIPLDELDSIFDKFVQSSRTRTGSGGTGLGLAICKEIIAQHSGKIWAESEENGKTMMTFSIKRKLDSALPPPPETKS
jgi:signal transduction histidine kinase